MDITLLIVIMSVLLGLLLILVLVYVSNGTSKPEQPASSKPSQPMERKKEATPQTFESLEAIVLDRNCTKQALRDAAKAIASQYGQVHATTLQRYSRIIVALCRHPQTDKQIIIDFDKSLRKQNPNLKIELEMALQKGLDSRG